MTLGIQLREVICLGRTVSIDSNLKHVPTSNTNKQDLTSMPPLPLRPILQKSFTIATNSGVRSVWACFWRDQGRRSRLSGGTFTYHSIPSRQAPPSTVVSAASFIASSQPFSITTQAHLNYQIVCPLHNMHAGFSKITREVCSKILLAFCPPSFSSTLIKEIFSGPKIDQGILGVSESVPIFFVERGMNFWNHIICSCDMPIGSVPGMLSPEALVYLTKVKPRGRPPYW